MSFSNNKIAASTKHLILFSCLQIFSYLCVPQVGFCSKQCKENAKNPQGSYPGRHSHDCIGLLPCLRLDDVLVDFESKTGVFSHLAYNCVANTQPKDIAQYLCSTGKYRVRDDI